MGTIRTLREGKWDCSDCLTVGILGRHKNCPECGNPRDPILTPEEKPYLPADAPEVTSPELIALFNDGPDWNCGFCGEANAAKYDTCSKCGRAKDSDDTVNRTITYTDDIGTKYDQAPDVNAERVEDDLVHAERIVEHPDDPRVLDSVILPADAIRHSGELADRFEEYDKEKTHLPHITLTTKNRNILLGIVGGIFLFLFSFFIYNHYFTTDPINLTITKLSWNRQIEVEKYMTLHEDGWDYPSDARVTDHYQKIHHYNHVATGSHIEHYTTYESYQSGTETYYYSCGSRTVDNGNGGFRTETETCSGTRPVYSSRSVDHTRTVTDYTDIPEYHIYYEYDIDRWTTSRWLVTQNEDHNPQWASTVGNFSSLNIIGNERIGNDRRETYTVNLIDDSGKKSFTQNISFSIWTQLEINDQVTGQINHAGHLRSVDWKVKVTITT
jgi:hypothetical protein